MIFGSAALIVDDVNDNYPEIIFPEEKETVQIREQTFATLLALVVDDLDMGPNASYEIILSQEDQSEEFSKAFNIIPSNGYQRQSFTISVANTTLIDYEVDEWQKFDITVSYKTTWTNFISLFLVFSLHQIKATEVTLKEHETTKTFKVELLNWNDELPKFDEDEYIFSVLETVSKDSPIGTVTARDRDKDDIIEWVNKII